MMLSYLPRCFLIFTAPVLKSVDNLKVVEFKQGQYILPDLNNRCPWRTNF